MFINHVHQWLNYQQFTFYWVDTLSYAVFIKVLYNLFEKHLLYFL